MKTSKRLTHYMRENPRNKKYKRAKVKNVTNAEMKGNGHCTHISRIGEKQVHLVCATDADRVFGSCYGAGSAGEGYR